MEMRGFIFTLDVIIAIIIVMTVLISSYSFFIQSPKSVLSLNKDATDILFILDENGTIATIDNQTIYNAVLSLVPRNTQFTYNITYYNVSGSSLIFDKSFYFSNIPNESDVIVDVRVVPILINETNSQIKNLTRIARAKLGVSI